MAFSFETQEALRVVCDGEDLTRRLLLMQEVVLKLEECVARLSSASGAEPDKSLLVHMYELDEIKERIPFLLEKMERLALSQQWVAGRA